jgi:hypothetical protein
MTVSKPLIDETTRVIFLDIDGVLHGFRDTTHFKPSCVEALRRIVVSTEARIVLSSSWRCTPETIAAVDTALAAVGIAPVIGCTPTKKQLRSRVAEILNWLERNPALKKSRAFVCLDDMDLATGAKDGSRSAICENVVRTDPDEGLTESDAKQAIQILTSAAGSARIPAPAPPCGVYKHDASHAKGAAVASTVSTKQQGANAQLPASVVGSDGSTYELGALSPDDTIFAVKQKLSEQSQIELQSMSLFLTGDIRNCKESLELKNREKVQDIKSYLEPETKKVEFSVLVLPSLLWAAPSDIIERPINKVG